MSKMPKDIKEFHDTLAEIAKYLIIMDPTIAQYYDFRNYEYDEYPHGKQKYKYHRLVLSTLELKNPAQIEDIEHCYNLKLVMQAGGTEGDEGVPYFYIFKFKDKYYRLSGHYSSYDDSPLYWNDLHEVVPEEKTVTVYKRADGNGNDDDYMMVRTADNYDEDSF